MLRFMRKHSLVMPGRNFGLCQRAGRMRGGGTAEGGFGVCGVVMGMVGAGVGEAGVI